LRRKTDVKNSNIVTAVWVGILSVGLIAAALSATSELRGRGSPGPASAERTAPDDSGPPDAAKGRVMEKATFGAGCFWGVEQTFARVRGVTSTQVGYMGGTTENPTYQQVCTDKTGHAEVCEVTFDPAAVSYRELLEVFWGCHDPTQVDRQGPDHGRQYRSVIFYHSPEQRVAAEKSREALGKSGEHAKPVATAIEPAATFWRAEEYHQGYFQKRGGGGCHLP
jgi:peptide-methionine (S)-S-oxide reductase